MCVKQGLSIYASLCSIPNFKIVAMNVEESNSASSFKWYGMNKVLVCVPLLGDTLGLSECNGIAIGYS